MKNVKDLEKYRPSMSIDVLHSWAKDAQDKIETLLEDKRILLNQLKSIASASPEKWEMCKDDFEYHFKPWLHNVCKTTINLIEKNDE